MALNVLVMAYDPISSTSLGFITPASATMYWAYAIWELNGPGPDLDSKGQLGTLEVGQAPGHYLVGSIAAVYLTGLRKSPHLLLRAVELS